MGVAATTAAAAACGAHRSMRTCCRTCSNAATVRAAFAALWPLLLGFAHRDAGAGRAELAQGRAAAVQGEAPLVIALDLSSAVLANDLPPSRLLQARAKLATLAEATRGRAGRAGRVRRRRLHRRAADRRCRQRRAVPRFADAGRDAGRRQQRRACDRVVGALAETGGLRAGRHPRARRPRRRRRAQRRRGRPARGLSRLGARTRQRCRRCLSQRDRAASPTRDWMPDRCRRWRPPAAAVMRRCSADDGDLAALGVLDASALRERDGQGRQVRGLARRGLLAVAAADAAGAARVPSRRHVRGGAAVRVPAVAPRRVRPTKARLWRRADQVEHARMQAGARRLSQAGLRRRGEGMAIASRRRCRLQPRQCAGAGRALRGCHRRLRPGPAPAAGHGRCRGQQAGRRGGDEAQAAAVAATQWPRQAAADPAERQAERRQAGPAGQFRCAIAAVAEAGRQRIEQPEPAAADDAQSQDNGTGQTQPPNPRSPRNRPMPSSNARPTPSSARACSRRCRAIRRASSKRRTARRSKAGPRARKARPSARSASANEAWLRRVPDDPGGLLRAKFRLEYERRQETGEH